MSFVGMRPEDVARLATIMGRAGQHLQNYERDISRHLDDTEWRGPDADRFRADWRHTGNGSLRRAQSTLSHCAAELRSQAAAQREASAAYGGRYDRVPQWTETTTLHAAGQIPIRYANVDASGQVGSKIERNGTSYLVTVFWVGKGGASVGAPKVPGLPIPVDPLSVGVEGGAKQSRTYRVYSEAEAREIVRRTREAGQPNGAEIVGAVLPFVGVHGAAVDAWADVERALKPFADKELSHTVEVSSDVFRDVGVGGFHLEHGSGGRKDLVTGEITAFVSGKVDASGALGFGSGSASADVEAAVTVDKDLDLKTLTLTGSVGAHGKLNVPGAADYFAPERGMDARFEAELPLDDREVRDAAGAYLRSTKSGDSEGAAEQLKWLLDRSTVTVWTEDVSTRDAAVNGGFAEFGAQTSRTTKRDVFIREPGRGWEHHRAASD